ncbi:MAG: T9SS type A sorting domain-containing protein, partial [Bacteroidales bacterium]|nr:T9SS type A sorting domain-containing protein [Bacteroidales bacterium]
LAYDISKDGGQNWQNNVQAYDPTLEDAYNGRYPQGAIFNPPGNTDADQAYFHYFAPTLDGSNTGSGTDWGGYAYGVKQLAEGSTPTQHNRTSAPPYYQYLPSAFTVTQTGEAWMVDENSQGAPDEYNYLGELIVGRGTWSEGLSDFEYIFDRFSLEIHPDDFINDIKIAFAPDGMTWYICVMTNLPDVLPYTSYHPVLFKTTDGGDTWSDPIEVQLGGEDGLEPVQQFITDEILGWFFDPDPVPPRDEIDYYMGYECDLAVDAWGNPHISGMVCIADNVEGVIYTNEGLIAMFHIWSDDQGQTWKAFNLGDLKRFEVEFVNGDATISQFNRPQVATTMDGAIVFFSWLDTENPDIEDNSQPDIYFREYLPTLEQHGDVAENVTYLSAGMWTAYFGCMSHYVFSEVTESNYTCTIPFVYEEMTNNDPLLPVQFYYIPDFVKSYTITGIRDNHELPAVVSQNFPNPFSSKTFIKVHLLQDTHITLEIYNLTGSLVRTTDLGNLEKGIHDLELGAGGLSRGIYFYSVNTGAGRVTKKMIVQ